MNSPEQPVTLPLEYAAELAMEMHLMRGECSETARDLMQETQLDQIGLEECALLDEALAKAYRQLQGAVAVIKQLRAARGRIS
jgi:hypothetical protein